MTRLKKIVIHCLVDKLGLTELSIEELGRIATQAQTSKYSVIRAHSKTVDAAPAKLNIKINYIIRRIDSYWPAQVDKSLALYKILFIGQTVERIARGVGVDIIVLKFLISDFRKL